MTHSPRLVNWRPLCAALLAALATIGAFAALRSTDGAAGPVAAAVAPAPAPAGTVSPELARLAERDPDRRVEVIVQGGRGEASAALRAAVQAAGGEVTREVAIINAVGARMSAAAAERVARDAAVRAVSLNAAVKKTAVDTSRLATSFNQSVRADLSWNDRNYPSTGKGVTVAVVDTGIDGGHPDFRAPDGSSRVIASAVVNPDARTAGDSVGHGTHVAGLIAGNGLNRPAGDPERGRYIGTAPEANLVSVKVSNEWGYATVLDVIDGLQFVVDHKDDLGIRVVNLSVSSTSAESYRTDPLDAAVEQAWFAGIVVIAAAGNDGDSSGAVSYAPGNDPYVVTVGGVDDKGTKSVSDDVVARWSSRGRTQDGFAKPEVVAPGAHMVAPNARGSMFGALCSACKRGEEYIQLGGTSMSAGVASGIAADVIARNPDWTPDQVKGAIINKTHDVVLDGKGKTVVAGKETATNKAKEAGVDAQVSNVGLTPNSLIDGSTGQIDFTRATWRRATWRDGSDLFSTSWTRATWRYADPQSSEEAAEVEETRATWRRATWRVSFYK